MPAHRIEWGAKRETMQFDQILNEFTAYLKHELEEGRDRVALDPDTLAALRGKAARPAPAPVTRAAPPATPPAPSPRVAPPVQVTLEAIALRIAACTACGLCEQRTRTVPGQGNAHPEIAFVGEGPGHDEDLQGLAFVGKAGQLLTQMIEAMGYSRDEVWIGNIVKCRPPNNRTPLEPEMQSCLPFLKEQLVILQPKVIVCLGATAVKGLLATTQGITRMRGQWQSFDGIDVMPTFHPAYLLRNPSAKHDAWSDLKAVLNRLGKPVPKKS